MLQRLNEDEEEEEEENEEECTTFSPRYKTLSLFDVSVGL